MRPFGTILKTMSTMPYKFGDIVLVRYPFTNQASFKQRPAVVVSSRAYNDERPDVVLMAITSQLRPGSTLDDIRVDDWKSAGLLKPSAVKPVFSTLEQVLILKMLGAMTLTDQAALRTAINQIIG